MVLIFSISGHASGPMHACIHQFAYGGLFDPSGGASGVFWVLYGENEIALFRFPPDDAIPWHEVRVMIWKISEPTI